MTKHLHVHVENSCCSVDSLREEVFLRFQLLEEMFMDLTEQILGRIGNIRTDLADYREDVRRVLDAAVANDEQQNALITQLQTQMEELAASDAAEDAEFQASLDAANATIAELQAAQENAATQITSALEDLDADVASADSETGGDVEEAPAA
jgi:chromosome segregation ATPase